MAGQLNELVKIYVFTYFTMCEILMAMSMLVSILATELVK